jgi:hypothetical protein
LAACDKCRRDAGGPFIAGGDTGAPRVIAGVDAGARGDCGAKIGRFPRWINVHDAVMMRTLGAGQV